MAFFPSGISVDVDLPWYPPWLAAKSPWVHMQVRKDAYTVNALATLLNAAGGRRPASAVGYLYADGPAGEEHRRIIRGYGGVSGFVQAHGDIFAMEPQTSGGRCPLIRLRTIEEISFAAMADLPQLAWPEPRPCYFYSIGKCLKGANCNFSHDLPASLMEVNEPSLSELPLELLRDKSGGWHPIVEDNPRRSFCFVRQNTWHLEKLQEELEQIKAGTDWFELQSKKSGFVTRSTAWYVPEGCCCRYTYSEHSMAPQRRPQWLEEIEGRVLGEGCGLHQSEWPDSVNVNLYVDDGQSVGWHSDDEGLFRGCEKDCQIISASWGAPRNFEVALKIRQHGSGKPSVFRESLRAATLHSGDICTMEGRFQRHYSHQISKGPCASETPPPTKIRINLTWRHIVQHKPYCPLANRQG
mmetsp:Transcript_24553/g.47761  ORF Transcript_24553/g.47761 Transcript_24553/m.47761 type:complete len:411 (-) Transcript_24553:41-1273(-)